MFSISSQVVSAFESVVSGDKRSVIIPKHLVPSEMEFLDLLDRANQAGIYVGMTSGEIILSDSPLPINCN